MLAFQFEMTTPAPASSPAPIVPSPTPSGAQSAGPGRHARLPLYIALAAIVIVVVLLAAIILAPGPGSSAGGGGPLTFRGAETSANKAISSFSGGGWVPLFAAGIDSATSYSAPLNVSQISASNCTLTLASGASSTITLPAFEGNRSAGLSPIWEFAYRNAAGNVAIVSVISGSATVIGTLSGKCSTYFGLLSPIPSGTIDSVQAAAAVEPAARAFLQQYPNASALFGIVGGISIFGATIGSTWEVEYSSCSFNSTSGATGAVFNATVNATSGTVLENQTTTGVPCSSSTTVLLGRGHYEPGGPTVTAPAFWLVRSTRE